MRGSYDALAVRCRTVYDIVTTDPEARLMALDEPLAALKESGAATVPDHYRVRSEDSRSFDTPGKEGLNCQRQLVEKEFCLDGRLVSQRPLSTESTIKRIYFFKSSPLVANCSRTAFRSSVVSRAMTYGACRYYSAGCLALGTNLFLHFLDVSSGILMSRDFLMTLAERLAFGGLGYLHVTSQSQRQHTSLVVR
jgi:hypothetical protein